MDEHDEHTVSIEIKANPNHLSAKEWFEENVFRSGYYEEEEVVISGNEALRFFTGGMFTREVIFVA